MSRGAKLFISLTLLLATTAAVVAYLMRVNADPSVLVVAIDEYAYPWHPNAWAAEDAENLKTLAEGTKHLKVCVVGERETATFDEWLKAHVCQEGNSNFGEGGPGEGFVFPRYLAIAAYISAHLALDEAGTPCLLAPASGSQLGGRQPIKPGESEADTAWYGVEPKPLKDLLKSLSDEMNRERVNTWWTRSRNRKLIVLDLNRSAYDMKLGESPADLHAAIKKVVEETGDSELAVIVSCGPGERSWAVPELGGSLFSLHFAKAIAGAADRPGRGSGRVTLGEVFDYLKEQVPRDARRYRAASQTPECYFGTGTPFDFELAFAGNATPELAPKSYAVPQREADQIRGMWAKYQAWRSGMLPADPWAVAEAEGRLVHCERLLTAGPAHLAQLRSELADVGGLLAESPPSWPIEVAGRSQAARAPKLLDAFTADVAAQESIKQIDAWFSPPAASSPAASSAAAASSSPASAAGASPVANAPSAADAAAQQAETPELPRPIVHAAVWDRLAAAPQSGQTPDAAWLRTAALLFERSVADPAAATRADRVSPRDQTLLASIFEGFREAESAAANRPSQAAGRGEPPAKIDLDAMASLVPRLLRTHAELTRLGQTADPRLHSLLAQNQDLHRSFFEALDRWHLALLSEEGLLGAERILERLNPAEGGELAAAADQKRRAEETLRLCDAAAMELPGIAWALERLHPAAQPALRQKTLELAALVEMLGGSLDTLSDDAATAGRPNPSEFAAAVSNLRTAAIKPAREIGYREKSFDPVARRQMIAWLEAPTAIPDDLRNTLRSNLIDYYKNPPSIEQQTDDWSADPAAEPPTGAFSAELRRTLLAADADLAGALPTAGSAADVARLAFRRDTLDRQQRYAQQAAAIAGDADRLALAESDLQLARLAAAGRRLAPWVVRRSVQQSSPTRYRWACDAQRSLIELAETACVDFWDVDSSAGQTEANPYFARSAANFLDAAENDIPRQCYTARPLAAQALLITPRSSLAAFVRESQRWHEEIFAAVPETPVDPAAADISVENPVEKTKTWTTLRGDLRDGAAIAAAGETIGVRIDFASSTSTPRELRAFLRGRQSQRLIARRGERQVPVLQWNVDPARQTRVLVTAPPRQHRVLFLLDCSNSFDPDTLKVAKDTLLEIVRELPEGTEVGLMVFGHYSSWAFDQGRGRLLADQNPGYPKNLIPNVETRTPENDVDLLVPIKRLSSDLEQDIQKKLSPLSPYGYTPLYRAIDEGMRVLKQEQANRSGYVDHQVVITDGADNVYPAGINAPRGNPFVKPLTTLAKELKDAGIKLSIIKFAFAGDEDRGLSTLTQDITSATAAREDLEQRLKDILGVRSFSVAELQGRRLGERQVKPFGAMWASTPLDAAMTFRIAVETAGGSANEVHQDVPVRGGEFFDVRFDPDSKELLFQPHDETIVGEPSRVIWHPPADAIHVQPLVAEGSSRKYLRVALQRGDGAAKDLRQQPSLRPSGVWVELELSTKDEDKKVARLSDVSWETARKAPIFRIPYDNGMAERLRVWFRFDEPADGQTTTLTARWSEWGTGPLAERLPPPERQYEANGTTVELEVPTEARLRWEVRPIADGDSVPSLRSVSYTVGEPRRVTYKFDGRFEDFFVDVEEMPAEPEGGAGQAGAGWLVSDWLDAPAN